MVIIGNPPYSRSSYNKSPWIEGLLEEYKTSVRADESQIQSLSNDYIKFIRFAQWKLDKTGAGILGFITGHGYVSGPQARDMRASLLRSFDKIYILNLHGSVRRSRERAQQENDEPVFQIQQGTAILLGVKTAKGEGEAYYADLVGSLAHKFDFLSSHDVTTTQWAKATPSAPNFFFVPTPSEVGTEDAAKHQEYQRYVEIPSLFGTGDRQRDKEKRWATGFASQQDDLAISFSRSELEEKISALLATESEQGARRRLRLCSTNQWDYKRAKLQLGDGSWEQRIGTCNYRPFDERYTVFDRNVLTILRTAVMSQFLGGRNLGLVVSRVVNDGLFAHAFVSRKPVDKIFLSSKTSTNAYVFALYFSQSDHAAGDLLPVNGEVRVPNLAPDITSTLAKKLELAFVANTATGDLESTFGPEDVFNYTYALLHAPSYRSRYAQFLRLDFPRIPLTSSAQLFAVLARLGKRLIALHLMEEFGTEVSRFPISGSNKITNVKFVSDAEQLAGQDPSGSTEVGRIYINAEQYFADVPRRVWGHMIGGYQVSEKWLKDRKGRLLSFDELIHYQRIIAALAETIRLKAQIDAAIPSWPIE